jgi:hypothetical protein
MSLRTDSVCLCRKQPNMRQATPEAACLCKRMLASKVGVFGRVSILDISAHQTTAYMLRPPSCKQYAAVIRMSWYIRLSDVGEAAWKKSGTYTWRSRNVGRTPVCKLAFQFTRLAQSSGLCSRRGAASRACITFAHIAASRPRQAQAQ